MGSKFGRDCKLYHNTGTHAVPTWVEINDVKDLTLPLGKSEADVTTRKTGKYKAVRGVLREVSLDFEMIWDTQDAGFNTILNAFLNDTPIEVAVMDGSITTPGSQGLVATVDVLKCDRGEPVGEVVTATVTMKPTYAENAPEWLVVPQS